MAQNLGHHSDAVGNTSVDLPDLKQNRAGGEGVGQLGDTGLHKRGPPTAGSAYCAVPADELGHS